MCRKANPIDPVIGLSLPKFIANGNTLQMARNVEKTQETLKSLNTTNNILPCVLNKMKATQLNINRKIILYTKWKNSF